MPLSGTHSVFSELVSLPEELEEPSPAAAFARLEQVLQENKRAEDARSERLVNTIVGVPRGPPATEQQVTIMGTSVLFVPGCLPSLRQCVALRTACLSSCPCQSST